MGLHRCGGAAQNLHERDDKGQCFSGAGGSVDGDVLEAAEQGDRGRLNRSAELESALAQGLQHGI